MNRINFDCMVFCEDERKIAIGCKVNALPLEMCQSEFLFPHFQLKYCWWDWMHLCWYIFLFFFSLISAACKRKFQINTQNTHTCTTDKKMARKNSSNDNRISKVIKKNAIHTCNAQTKRFMFNWSWLTCQFSHRLLLFHVQNGDFKAIALLKHLNATQPVDVIRLTIADTLMLQFFLE